MKSSVQGKGLAAPDTTPSLSVNMPNLTRLSVLIAEGDMARSREAAELLRELGVRNIVHVDAAGSLLEALHRQAFDVLLCAERLDGEQGVALLRAARTAAPATRTVLMRSEGHAGEYVPEDVEAIELPFSRLALEGLLQRTAAPNGGLWCEVPELTLTDILQMYHQARRSITVLLSGPVAGRIHMESGEIVDAEAGQEQGMPALSRLLEAETGLLRTEPAHADRAHTISAPFQSVVLEAAHKLDERRRDSMISAHPPPGGGSNDLTVSGIPSGARSGTIGSERTSSTWGRSRPALTPMLEAHAPTPGSILIPRRRGWVTAAGLLACLVLIGVAALYLGRHLGGTDSSESTASATGNAAAGAGIEASARAREAEHGALEPTAANPTGAIPLPSEPPSSEPQPDPAQPPPPSSFELSITSRPSRATVTEAGRVLGKTPLTLTIQTESVAHAPREFLLRLPGHYAYKVTQSTSSSDVTARAVLSPRPPVAELPDGGRPPSEADAPGGRPSSRVKDKELGIRLRR
jgi:CheY-like chemotaxis protein